MRRLWLVLALGTGLVGCGGSDDDAEPATPSFFLSDEVLNVAHSGGKLLAPEETLLAYQKSVEAGADVLEGDVHATKDGVLVLIHDETIDATTNGSGNVSEMTFAELQAFDAGYEFSLDGGKTYPFRGQGLSIASVESLLDLYPEAYYVLEIKQQEPPIVTPFLGLLSDKGMLDQVLVASFWDDVITEVRTEAPSVVTSLATGETIAFAALKAEDEPSYEPPARFVQPPFASATADFIDRAHRLGMKVHPWTVNDPTEMQSLIDRGVDGIITDDPSILEGLLTQ